PHNADDIPARELHAPAATANTNNAAVVGNSPDNNDQLHSSLTGAPAVDSPESSQTALDNSVRTTSAATFPGPAPDSTFIIHSNDTEATMATLMALCNGGAPGNPDSPVMLTRRFAAWSSARVDLDALYLSTCFPIEISTSQGARSMGHCSDFVQYLFYAGARLNPDFPAHVLEEKLRRCPDSIYLHGEFPTAELFVGTGASLGAVRNFWMPNIEQLHIKDAYLFPHTHTFVAKTAITAKAIGSYLTRNKIDAKVRFMYHSTPDPVEQLDGVEYIQDFDAVLHAMGHSGNKHTYEVVECWLQHPEWPTLDVSSSDDIESFFHRHAKSLKALAAKNRGYGHYINMARALGAAILTSNHPPMSEFVEDGVSGVLATSTSFWSSRPGHTQLLWREFVSPYDLSTANVCTAAARLLALPAAERAAMGRRARQAYDDDTHRMARRLAVLRADA
ncbi:hypothetical protein HK405_014965, partial [Cladochytrium tenue]